jgi:hypothetical protein
MSSLTMLREQTRNKKRPRSRSLSPLQLSPSPSLSLSSSLTLSQATPSSSESAGVGEEQVVGTLENSTDADSEASYTSDNDSCSTASADMVTKTLNTFKKLTAYNIPSETYREMPAELAAFITNRIKASRDITSPLARNVGRDQLVAVRKSEREGIEILAPKVLLKDEKHGGEAYIIQDAEVMLEAQYLPGPPSRKVLDRFSKLSQPVADHAIGYISTLYA